MTEVTEIRCCKHWMQGKLARADDKCPWCEIDKLQEGDKRGSEMKLNLRWEPRWPAFAIGFYRGKRTAPYTMFHIILWALVIEFDWGKK